MFQAFSYSYAKLAKKNPNVHRIIVILLIVVGAISVIQLINEQLLFAIPLLMLMPAILFMGKASNYKHRHLPD